MVRLKVAGVGCDPREGFRHFNIMKQEKDYDPDGEYVKLWFPELKDVPDHYYFCPWLMSKEEQTRFKCKIGKDYPEPLVIFAAYSSCCQKRKHIDAHFALFDDADNHERKFKKE